MKTYTEEQIRAKAMDVWKADCFYDEKMTVRKIHAPSIEIDAKADCVRITVACMYESPSLNLSHMMELAEFFGTKNINDDYRFANQGCETCDYGSSYGFTLTIRPEAK